MKQKAQKGWYDHIEHGCIPTISGSHPEYMKNPDKNLQAIMEKYGMDQMEASRAFLT